MMATSPNVSPPATTLNNGNCYPESNRAYNGGVDARPSTLDQAGLVLPKMHLGSFSQMDVGNYFENVGLSPVSPDKRANGGGDPTQERSGSSDGRKVPLSTSPSRLSPRQESQSIRQTQHTPPTQDVDPSSSPRSTSSKVQPYPAFSGSFTSGGNDHLSSVQSGSPTTQSQLAYLPPGAASPHKTGLFNPSLPNANRSSRDPTRSPQDVIPSSPRLTRDLSPSPRNPYPETYSDVNSAQPTLVPGDRVRNSIRSTNSRRAVSQYVDAPYGSPQYSPQEQQTASYSLAPLAPANIVPSASPRISVNQASPYPSFPQAQYGQVQSTRVPPPVVMEEVCIECMMRDRDMADVDVTGEGAWERDSDVWYQDLVNREREEEFSRRSNANSSQESTGSRRKPSAKGGRLTEENVKIWLTMNPKEPQARWQTLEAYIKSQAALLNAEAHARSLAIRESRMVDNKMRDAMQELRRSAYEVGVVPDESTGSVRIPASRNSGNSWNSGSPGAESRRKRDLTVLDNGMIVERVDVKKEEKEEKARMKKEEKIERQRRRMSVSSPGYGGTTDGASIYSMSSPNIDYGNHPLPPQSPSSMKRMSILSTNQLNPPRPTMQRGTSQASVESTGVRRFFGRHFSGASQASLAISGSMMDMHLGLDQDRHATYPSQPHRDFSAPPSMAHASHPNEPWQHNGMLSEPEAPTTTHEATVSSKSKKKSKGLGKIWKIMTGQKDHAEEAHPRALHDSPGQEEDFSAPLAPPPPLSVLARERSEWSPPNHRQSMPPASHPRSASTPAPGSMGVSPPSAPSSLLPSPTSNRFPFNASDERRSSANKDDVEVDLDTSEDRDDPNRGAIRRASGIDSGPQGGFLNVPRPPGAASPVTIRSSSLNKSLPPLPHEIPSFAAPNRPSTFYSTNPPLDTTRELAAPNPSFRQEMRRQSFNGLTSKISRPSWGGGNNAAVQNEFAPPPSIGVRYDEFGGSRRSLGKFEDMRGRGSEVDLSNSKRSTKTRSRFGFGSLFGGHKKHTTSVSRYEDEDAPMPLPPPLNTGDPYHSRSLSHSSFSETGYAGDRSNGSMHPRMSIASTKKLGELVSQSEDFVAYRYPSTDQPFVTHR